MYRTGTFAMRRTGFDHFKMTKVPLWAYDSSFVAKGDGHVATDRVVYQPDPYCNSLLDTIAAGVVPSMSVFADLLHRWYQTSKLSRMLPRGKYFDARAGTLR